MKGRSRRGGDSKATLRRRARRNPRARSASSSPRLFVSPSLPTPVSPPPDKYDCYELCVQNPARLAPFLLAVHASGGRGGKRSARILREDFCGTGGVCRAWAAMPSPASKPFRAIGVDLDPEPLARLRGLPGIKAVEADVLDCDARADIISATNFPIGYWSTRPRLIRYLRLCRQRLRPGGVLVCDTYGGSTAFTIGSTVRDIWADDGLRIRYTWEQREADPLTGMVTDCLHFRADRDGEIIYQEADAFVYRWRLWSIAELREAMKQAGFRSTEVYSELADAVDSDGNTYVRPVEDPEELGDNYIVLIAARAE